MLFAKHIETIASPDSSRIWTRAEKAFVDGDAAELDALLARHGDMLRTPPAQSSWWGGLAPDYSKGDARAIIAREHHFESWDQFAAFAEALAQRRRCPAPAGRRQLRPEPRADLAVHDGAARLDAAGPPPYAAGMDLPRTLSPGEAAAIRQFVARVRELLGTELRYVRLFGSRARGEGHEHSDLDIALIVAPGGRARRYAVYDLAFDVGLEHSVDLAPLVLEEQQLQELKRRERLVALDIEREGIAL